MKTDRLPIDKFQLIQTIKAAYGLSLSHISFVPKGEDAFAYIGYGDSGEQYFVRVQPVGNTADLQNICAYQNVLSRQNHMSFVVAPLLTLGQAAAISLGDYHLAIFPYVASHTLYEQKPEAADIEKAAILLAHLHQAPLISPTFPRETFVHPFGAPIQAALAEAGRPLSKQTARQSAVCNLLIAAQNDILATLTYMEQLREQILARPTEWVLTHGDPNLDNVLKDAQGQLHLVDWGEMAIGPAERDLMHWTGDAFEQFLVPYANLRPNLTLDADLFKFYFYRWSLQEIADYAPRILFADLGPVENEHAWTELQDYLPIRHDAIADGVQAVQSVIRRVL